MHLPETGEIRHFAAAVFLLLCSSPPNLKQSYKYYCRELYFVLRIDRGESNALFTITLSFGYSLLINCKRNYFKLTSKVPLC